MWKVRMYMNTGFNTVNVPDSEATLNSAAESHTDFPVIDCLQRYFLSSIKIRAYEDQVIQGDYIKLWDESNSSRFAFYSVNGYTMTSGDTIELSISMDSLLTCGGVDNIDFLDGVTNRYNASDNTMNMRNVEDDPLLIPHDLHLICLGEYFGDDYNRGGSSPGQFHFGGSCKLIVSSLYNIFEELELDSGVDVEVSESSWEGILTASPIVKKTTRVYPTKFYNYYGGGQVDSSIYADGNAYWVLNSDQTASFYDLLQERCEKILRYGRQDVLTNAYFVPTKLANGITVTRSQESQSVPVGALNIAKMVPAESFTYQESGGGSNNEYFDYSSVSGVALLGDKDLRPMYQTAGGYTVKNRRAVMGKNFDFVFMVRDSGDTKRVSSEEISYKLAPQHNSHYIPAIGVSVDLRPNGHVEYGIKTEQTLNVDQDWENPPHIILKSGEWEKAHLFTTAAVGSMVNAKNFNIAQQLADASVLVNMAHQANKAGYMTRAAGDAIGGVAQGLNPQNDLPIGSGVSGLFNSVADIQTMSGGYQLDAAMEARRASIAAGRTGEFSMASEAGAGNDYALTMFNRDIERRREQEEFINANYPTTQVISGGGGGSTTSSGQGLLVYRYFPTADDVERFDRILNQFGCKITVPTEKSQLKCRRLYNYIEASSVSIKCNTVPKSVRNDLANLFSAGLRIWHTDPKDHNYREENAYVNA